MGFLCGGETWTRVAGPIPSSPVNSMARGVLPKSGAAVTTAAAPRTTASIGEAPKPPGQKQAANGQPSDAVGDICLLPDIARFTH